MALYADDYDGYVMCQINGEYWTSKNLLGKYLNAKYSEYTHVYLDDKIFTCPSVKANSFWTTSVNNNTGKVRWSCGGGYAMNKRKNATSQSGIAGEIGSILPIKNSYWKKPSITLSFLDAMHVKWSNEYNATSWASSDDDDTTGVVYSAQTYSTRHSGTTNYGTLDGSAKNSRYLYGDNVVGKVTVRADGLLFYQ